MTWNTPTLWWLAAGALVALELTSGTFYLLMLSLGCVAGALAAHLGFGGTSQVVAAALLGGGATVAWHLRRTGRAAAGPVQGNRDVNLDIGEHVKVEAWSTDGSAQVKYRGAAWSVQYAGSGTPAPGEHVIVAVHGNKLSVAPRS